MMLNKFTIIYIVLLVCSTAVGLGGALAGITAVRGKSFDQLGPEARHRVEQWLYLSFSALGLGLALRLVLAPTWFFMLESLVAAVPGAMCLVGVHQNVPLWSWISSSLKLLLPAFYFTWLVAGFVDKKLREQPLLGFRIAFLAPIALLLLVEAGSDLYFLFSLKPIKVSCCSAFLGSGQESLAAMTTTTNCIYRIIAYAAIAILLILNLKGPGKRAETGFGVAASILLPLFLGLALQKTITPVRLPEYFTNVIYHQCIFCLLRSNPGLLAAAFLLLGGSLISYAVCLIVFCSWGKEGAGGLYQHLNPYRRTAAVLFATGFVLWLISSPLW